MSIMYEPLDMKRAQFRRLILLPAESGSLDDQLVGSLEKVWYDETPEYEALSYVWGSPTPAKQMLLNGRNVEITPNLDCALRHLRQPDSQRLLWVDALCINQKDLDEKAHQIKLMRPIYALASGVVLWLGPATDQTDAAMRSIEKLDKEYWSTYDFQVNFMELLYRPWFTRIWVVQEFVVGWPMKGSPRIGCGSIWVPWLSFFSAWKHYKESLTVISAEYTRQFQQDLLPTFEHAWITQVTDVPFVPSNLSDSLEDRILTGLRAAFGNDFLPRINQGSNIGLLDDIRANPILWRARNAVMQHCLYKSPAAQAYWRWLELTQIMPLRYCEFLMHARVTVAINRKSLTFEEILKGTMNLRSTDARDKIYGILGLVSQEARNAIPIDYRKPPEWTFVPTMAYIIEHEPGGLALLGLLWRTRHFKTPIPSWVADFTVSADHKDEHSPVFLRGSCANANWSWKQDVVISKDQTTLSTSGISFGKVTHLISFIDGDRFYYVDRFREIQSLVINTCPSSQEPLWRTLVGVRNTNPELLKPFSKCWDELMSCPQELGAETHKMYREDILVTIRKRKFFVTDVGFCGVATPMIREGDTLVIIPGMIRVAVLREADPKDLKIHIDENVKRLTDTFHRITGFAYLACHDREEFEQLGKQGLDDANDHICLRRSIEKFYIF